MDQSFGDYITLERAGRVVTVTFDRGDGTNALSIQAMRDLTRVAQVLSEDTECSVIILQGQGAFSVGADLKDPEFHALRAKTLVEQRQFMKVGPDMCQAWQDLEPITIAAIETFCIGGGLALALACDHRIAGDDTLFQLPEVSLGMNMSWRAIPRIVNLIGPSRAKLLTALGRRVEADTAHAWGLIDEITNRGDALSAAHSLAQEYAALPPLALRMTKQAINASAAALDFSTSYMDRDQFLLTTRTEDFNEAILAKFEKRTPEFKGN